MEQENKVSESYKRNLTILSTNLGVGEWRDAVETVIDVVEGLPEESESLKELKLSSLQAGLVANEGLYNDKGSSAYKNPQQKAFIAELREKIKKTEKVSGCEVVVDEILNSEQFQSLEEGQGHLCDKAFVERCMDFIKSYETKEKGMYCRLIAEKNVTDAFKRMGVKSMEEKNSQKITQIVNINDPDIVNEAINNLAKMPTENLRELADITKTEKRDRGSYMIMQIYHILIACVVGVGANLLLQCVAPEMSPRRSGWINGAMFGFLTSWMCSRNIKKLEEYVENKENNIPIKNDLVSKCLNDLVDEIARVEEKYKNAEFAK